MIRHVGGFFILKKVEVLSIGTELLMGQIANTNAQYISRRVPELGMGVFYHSVVGDNPDRLKKCLEISMERSDIIITTGGLGPTQDDLTKETIAEALGLKMLLHQPSKDKIINYFIKNGKIMSENNLRQAYFPENSIILENEWGTAPACIIDNGYKVIIMLPGPPRELIPLFDKYVMSYLKKFSDTPLTSKFLKIVGVGESTIEDRLMELVNSQVNPTIATYAKDCIVTIRVTAHAQEDKTADELVNDMCDKICNILGDSVYTTDNIDLENYVLDLLKKKGYKFACAESCTGGLLADRITAVPGASQVFYGGFITYTNESKIRQLDVLPDTIDKYTAVSRQTALEMVKGVCNKTNAHVGVSITGYAGPADEKGLDPVGKVFIGLITPEGESVYEFNFTGNRDRIRMLCVVNALELVRRSLMGIRGNE